MNSSAGVGRTLVPFYSACARVRGGKWPRSRAAPAPEQAPTSDELARGWGVASPQESATQSILRIASMNSVFPSVYASRSSP